MNSLIIGQSSQLAYYFSDDYKKISSRNIFNKIKHKYDRVYLCFGEHRTFIENDEQLFININVDYTLKVIDFFKNSCNKIILYSTCELWNNCEGPVNLNMPFNYNYSPYIKSKEIMHNYILENKSKYENVIILYPFNFNSPYRKSGFLFGKIFDSIINNKKIEIGDTHFYRDFIHPSHLAERSILANKNELVGSGRLLHVNDFIQDLYKWSGRSYDDLVTENFDHNLKLKRKIFYLDSNKVKNSYDDLLYDTLQDIKKMIKKRKN